MKRTFQNIFLSAFIALAGCDIPGSTAVIDTRIPPTIIEASITPDNIDIGKITTPGSTAVVTIKGYVNASDDNGLSDIASVRFTVYSPDGKLYASGILHDNGIFPDAAAGDGKYNSDISLTLPKDIYGIYNIQFITEDAEGYTSNTFNLPLTIIYSLNHAPSVSNFSTPDTVFVPSTGTNFIFTSVRASDAEGQNDITNVSMSIVRPNDSSIVAVYGLFDDGGIFAVPPFSISSGDSIAGDGIYTLKIPVPSSTLKNIERFFNVFAVDQSNVSSNILTKKVFFQ